MRKKIITLLLSITILSLTFLFNPVSAAGNGEILIIRDDYGVPHIFADTKEGLAFGMGYAVAQDRLWQTDLYRRDAFGSLAEFGLASINSDYNTRKLGYSKEELQEIFDNWIPTQPEAKLKEMSLAYVDGLNAYINEAQTRLFVHGDPSMIPIEYLANDGALLPIEPFTIADTTAIVVMMAWRFGGTGGGELGFASSLKALESMYDKETAWEIFNDNYPQVDPGAPTTIPGQGSHYPKGVVQSSIPTLPDNIDDIYQEVIGNIESQTEMLASLGLPTKFGSDAWMIRPKKSLTRNAMQVGGPQMGQSIPQIVLEVGLHGAGINAVGMAMPHAPTILIGASDFGAWTSTTGSSDLIDTYIEVLNPLDHTQYKYNGVWKDMEVRTEIFYSAIEPTQEIEIYRTIHGPILSIDKTNHLAYTVKSPYYKNELAAEEGWSLFQQARNINDFQEATKVVTAGHNFFWIDRRGNIGFWHSGAFPIKPITGKDGRIIDDRFPLLGTGEEEWVGVTGFDEMPKSINPAQGFLANWNNKPTADWPYSEADWGEVHRVKRIQDLLGVKTKFSFDDMNEINKDAGYNHISAMYFLEFLTNAAKADSSIPSEVVAALEAWDHHYNDYLAPRYPNPNPTYDDPGLTIYDAWFGKIDDEVFDDDLPPGVGGSDSTLLHVFDGEDSKLPLNFDYLNGEDRDTVIVRVLKEALADLELDFGSDDVSTWLTPVQIVEFFQQGALPSPTMHAMNRGTYNHIVEMPRWKWKDITRQDPPNAFNVIPPGQSGFMNYQFQFDHAYDQLPLYETWTYKPMLFHYSAIEAVAESFTTLYY